MSIDLHKELARLRRDLLTMGASVEKRVGDAVHAMIMQDVREAREVRTGDDEINTMDIDIERECLRILSLAQPVARDLRFVMATMRINTDLERIADLAKSAAKRIIAMDEYDDAVHIPDPLRQMAEGARGMLHDAMTALSNSDPELCRSIRRADQQVDDLLKEMYAWAQEEIPRYVEHTPATLDMLSVARKLERIADMATNIAEDVIFIVEGAVVRHIDPEGPDAAAPPATFDHRPR